MAAASKEKMSLGAKLWLGYLVALQMRPVLTKAVTQLVLSAGQEVSAQSIVGMRMKFERNGKERGKGREEGREGKEGGNEREKGEGGGAERRREGQGGGLGRRRARVTRR